MVSMWSNYGLLYSYKLYEKWKQTIIGGKMPSFFNTMHVMINFFFAI